MVAVGVVKSVTRYVVIKIEEVSMKKKGCFWFSVLLTIVVCVWNTIIYLPDSGALAASSRSGNEVGNVLLVHSSYQYGGFEPKTEFDTDFAALGWDVTKVNVEQLGEMLTRLEEFDLVIFTSVLMRGAPVTLNDYATAFHPYLKQGGALLITDASEGQPHGWLRNVHPDLALEVALCRDSLRDSVADSPLMTVPNRIADHFEVDAVIFCRHPLPKYPDYDWHHLSHISPGWQVNMRCKEGAPLFVSHRMGRGIVCVTTMFKGLGIDKRLLENIWLHARLNREDLSLLRLGFGPGQLGENTLNIVLQNERHQQRTLNVEATLPIRSGGVIQKTSLLRLPPGGEGEARLTLDISGDGLAQLVLSLKEGTDGGSLVSWRWYYDVPPRLVLDKVYQYYVVEDSIPTEGEVTGNGRLPHPQVLEVALFGASEGSPLSTSRFEVPQGGRFSFSVDIASIPPGEFRAQVRLLDDNGEAMASAERRYLKGAEVNEVHTHRFDEEGNLLLDGERFFPFGFYGVWTESYPILAENGFNTIYGGEWEEASRWGLKSVYPISWDDAEARRTISRSRFSPAVIGYQTVEEPSNCTSLPSSLLSGVSNLERNIRLAAAARKLAPLHPVFTVLNNPLEFPSYGPIGDFVITDPYCINGPISPLTMVSHDVDLLHELCGEKFPVWTILQAHAFTSGESPPKRVWHTKPTREQLRCETYLALAHNVKGILYFIFDWQLPKGRTDITWIHNEDGTFNEELWVPLKQMAQEMERLRPFIFAPRSELDVTIESESHRVDHLLKVVEGKRYLLLVNPLSDPTHITVSLPPQWQDVKKVLFFLEAQRGPLAVKEGRFSEWLEGYGVRIYVF